MSYQWLGHTIRENITRDIHNRKADKPCEKSATVPSVVNLNCPTLCSQSALRVAAFYQNKVDRSLESSMQAEKRHSIAKKNYHERFAQLNKRAENVEQTQQCCSKKSTSLAYSPIGTSRALANLRIGEIIVKTTVASNILK